MSNPIKYSTGSETQSLKRGNIYFGSGDVGKGPTSSTGYYNGYSPPSGGYMIYLYKSGAPGDLSYFSAANDTQLITFTNNLANTSFTSATQCLNYFVTQTDKMVFNIDYPPIVTSGLVLNVDAAFVSSYTTSGTSWYDLSTSGNTASFINGPTFDSNDLGSISLDGTNDEIVLSNPITFFSSGTVSAWIKYNDVSGSLTFASGQSYEEGYWFYTEGNDVYTNWGNSFNGFGSIKSTFQLNEKFYLTLTLGGGKSNLYKNGILLSSVSYTPNTNGVLRSFGRLYKGGGGNYANMNGNIYSVQIYNRTLSATEVLQNYNAQKGRFGL